MKHLRAASAAFIASGRRKNKADAVTSGSVGLNVPVSDLLNGLLVRNSSRFPVVDCSARL